MNDRRIRVLLTPIPFLNLVGPPWAEQALQIMQPVRGLAERLAKDNIQCLVGLPFLPRWEELDKLTDEEALTHYFLDKGWRYYWRRIFWDDPINSLFFRELDYLLRKSGTDFILVPVARESIRWLEEVKFFYPEFPPPFRRMVFVDVNHELPEFHGAPGFNFVHLPPEYPKLLRILKRPEDGLRYPPLGFPQIESPAEEERRLEDRSPGRPPSPSREETPRQRPPASAGFPPAYSWPASPPPARRKRLKPAPPPPPLRTTSPATRVETRPVQTEVFLGAATPRVVVPGSEFVARFAAYVEKFRQQVSTIFAKEAPKSESLLDLASCRWQVGTKVSVRLSARDLTVKTGPQSFRWNGEYETLRFDVEVPPDCEAAQAVLKFDIMIDGVIIATLRPEIEISKALAAGQAMGVETTEVRSPRSAFASYAKRDRRNVLGRVRSLQIHTGIDVFFDCLSIRPGEEWKPEIVKQIRDREIFWLFWSRRARKSNWVEWEWRQALAAKTLRGIQPHPLEPSELAPPPAELEDLQFGTAYECYLVTLQESWLKYRLHCIKETVSRLFRNQALSKAG